MNRITYTLPSTPVDGYVLRWFSLNGARIEEHVFRYSEKADAWYRPENPASNCGIGWNTQWATTVGVYATRSAARQVLWQGFVDERNKLVDRLAVVDQCIRDLENGK